MQASRETQGRMLCFFDLIKLMVPVPPKKRLPPARTQHLSRRQNARRFFMRNHYM
ncbi:hypothetical protein P2D89_00860 [Agrobacterium rhizogenes]|uniref:hypothetical protein n=1 Tax=Rhizobium rhizogenes TaxID=359 RepID=UPI0028677BEA|nr:hypothetical protein [Rhizobium rhizogenes]MDF1887515.1 hypothetical protein [Rhizobium rhizogenes]